MKESEYQEMGLVAGWLTRLVCVLEGYGWNWLEPPLRICRTWEEAKPITAPPMVYGIDASQLDVLRLDITNTTFKPPTES